MHRGIVTVAFLVVLGLSLGGCTKCGWLWQDGPHACRADAPRG